MKQKKFERQQREKSEREEQKKQEFRNNLKTVLLTPVDNENNGYMKIYSWKCPEHHGSFSYSQEINDRWGHPHEYVFCAVCRVYHKFEIGSREEVIV